MIRHIFERRGAPLLLLALGILLIAEGRRQLRRRTQPRWKRALINTLVAIPAFTLLRYLLLPVMVRLAQKNELWKFGLNHRYKAHPLLKGLVSFLILDYTNYLWHRLNHKVPLLWRFHVVHHTDHDLDVTTAFRFHFGELIGSVFYRGAFVLASGATAVQVLLYEVLFEGATQFHHSNVRLPFGVEKFLNKVIVTPRMHGIHHSIIREETDSNYSVIFSCWDRLHQTIRLNVPQSAITTGVPTYHDPQELTVGYLLRLPFSKIRTDEGGHERRSFEAGGRLNQLEE